MSDFFWVMILGFGMGFIGSIPPLGPVALMMINRVFNRQLKFAFAIGVGGALAEVIYSALAVTGVGLLRSLTGITRDILGLTSASILLVVGIYFFYQTFRPKQESVRPEVELEARPDGTTFSHFVRGFTIAIVNPILIVNWTLAVVYFFSLFHLKTNLVGQLLFAGAVGVGKILWTGIEVVLLDKFRQRFARAILGRVERGLSIAVILSALLLAYQSL